MILKDREEYEECQNYILEIMIDIDKSGIQCIPIIFYTCIHI